MCISFGKILHLKQIIKYETEPTCQIQKSHKFSLHQSIGQSINLFGKYCKHKVSSSAKKVSTVGSYI
jgi:hypothetical protein